MSYLLGCVSQLVAEVLLFETMECIWMQFLIPSLVSSEVERVNRVLSNVLMQMCTHSVVVTAPTSPDSVLNVADYLFVSSKVARANPHLMESFIVLSYRSHLPGELSHVWTHHHAHVARRGSSSFLRFLTLLGVVALNVLQTLATAPAVLHRMFIRFIQPFFLAVLLYAGSYVIESPVYTAVTAVGVALLVAALVYKYLRSRSVIMSSIHPAATDSYSRSSQREDDLEPITLQHQLDSGSSSFSGSDFSIESPSSMSSRSTISEGSFDFEFSEEESDDDDDDDDASIDSDAFSI